MSVHQRITLSMAISLNVWISNKWWHGTPGTPGTMSSTSLWKLFQCLNSKGNDQPWWNATIEWQISMMVIDDAQNWFEFLWVNNQRSRSFKNSITQSGKIKPKMSFKPRHNLKCFKHHVTVNSELVSVKTSLNHFANWLCQVNGALNDVFLFSKTSTAVNSVPQIKEQKVKRKSSWTSPNNIHRFNSTGPVEWHCWPWLSTLMII